MPTSDHAPSAAPSGSTLDVRGLTLEWGARTFLMGVLNVTPDSFSGDGMLGDLDGVVERAGWMIEGGADLLDVGGESTRPGAREVSEEEELERVLPVIRALRSAFDAPISIDTCKAAVAAQALDAGADLVNDVWAMARDPGMMPLVAHRGVPVVLMDNRSDRDRLQVTPQIGGHYRGDEVADIVSAVASRLEALASAAVDAGVRRERIILDPGIGFGKSRDQNLALLDRLDEIRALGFPVLVGPSRKSFIGLTLGVGPEDRVEGSAAAVAVAIARGADMVRIHDVTVMSRVARMTDAIVRRSR